MLSLETNCFLRDASSLVKFHCQVQSTALPQRPRHDGLSNRCQLRDNNVSLRAVSAALARDLPV